MRCALLVLPLVSVACAAPVPLDWTVSLADPALCAGVVAFEARIERGGCGGEIVYEVTRFRGAGDALPTPDRLSPGTWGFRVRARDASCRFVADRCIERALPAGQPALDVDVTCGPPMEAACATCDSGVCVGVDPPPPPRLAWPPSAYATGSPHAAVRVRLRWDAAPSATRYEVALGPPCDGAAIECALDAMVVPTGATELALDALGLARVAGGERRAWSVRSCRDDGCGPLARARILALDRLDGDLDADGYADALLGAPEEGGGRVVVRGGAASLGGPEGSLDPGLEPSARFGLALASADLDGDGRGDALVGAPFADGDAGGDAGAAYLARGGDSPARLDPGPGSPAETLGAAVAIVGDVDGDGFLDVALGAPQSSERADDAGRVVVLYGSRAGLGRATALAFEPAPGAAFGAALAGGDLDGDGFADVVIGEPGRTPAASTPEAGRVLVFRGGPAGVATTPQIIAPSTPQARLRFGQAVEVLDDLDGDGLADLAVGAPGWDAAASPDQDDGRVFVYSGSEAGVHTVLPQELANPFLGAPAAVGERFGVALASGDVDGDGRTDLVVGAPAAAPDGAVLVYLSEGLRLGDAPSRILDRASPGAEHGAAVGVGDLDGDGVDDVAAIARAEERARLYLGAPGGPVATPTLVLGDGRGLRGAAAIGR